MSYSKIIVTEIVDSDNNQIIYKLEYEENTDNPDHICISPNLIQQTTRYIQIWGNVMRFGTFLCEIVAWDSEFNGLVCRVIGGGFKVLDEDGNPIHSEQQMDSMLGLKKVELNDESKD